MPILPPRRPTVEVLITLSVVLILVRMYIMIAFELGINIFRVKFLIPHLILDLHQNFPLQVFVAFFLSMMMMHMFMAFFMSF